MKKYYKESDTAFSINSSSELNRKNNTITPNGTVLKTFVQPELKANGSIGGDSFAVKESSNYSGYGAGYFAFDGNSSTGLLGCEGEGTYNLIMYNPTPLLITGISYDTDNYYTSETYFNADKNEHIILYGSDTGEFNGEEEIIKDYTTKCKTLKSTVNIEIPDNIKAYKYHKLHWLESPRYAWRRFTGNSWNYYYCPYGMMEIRLTAYEVEENNENYAKSLNIKQHVVTDVNGNFVVIPAQEFDITTLENGIYDLFSNIETKKTEALPVETESKKDNLVKIGSVKLVSSKLIADIKNEEFNAVKKEHPYYLGKYKCGYNGRKTYLPLVPEFLYYKNTTSGIKEADKTDYDFFAVRPSFNVQDGGVMCFSKEDKNGDKS